MKLNKLLLIISIVLISLGGAMFIAGAVLALLGSGLGDLFMGLSGIFGFAAIGVLIFRLFRMAKEPGLYEEPRPKVVVKIVDVKEVPKSHEQKLYEQYEDLYKRNLITKEELDQKRIELLGK